MRNPYAVHRAVDNEYLVRERDRRLLRELLVLALILAPVAVALAVFTWVHLQVVATSYRIGELDRSLHDLERQESELRLEAAYLASPGLVEERASRELGMTAPSPDQLLFLDMGSAVDGRYPPGSPLPGEATAEGPEESPAPASGQRQAELGEPGIGGRG